MKPGEVYVDPDTGKERVRIFGSITENPYLEKSYLDTLKSVNDPNKRKAWIFGDWDIASGGIFEDVWKREVHSILPFKIPSGWRVDRSFDWGSSAPYVCLWFAESDGSPRSQGRLIRRSP